MTSVEILYKKNLLHLSCNIVFNKYDLTCEYFVVMKATFS